MDVGSKLLSRYPDLRAVLTAGALNEFEAAKAGAAIYSLDALTLLPVIPNPQKIICVGLNYRSHRKETKRPDTEHPSIFTRFADSQVGHGAPILRPRFSDKFDWEGELAVVIGKGGRHIPEDKAFDHVAGYSCYNDVTVRDWQRHTIQWIPGKTFPGTGPFGPALVTRDEIPDLNACVLTTRLNGQVVQQAPIADLIFTIPVIRRVNYVSRSTSVARAPCERNRAAGVARHLRLRVA